jgi:hypothetical protein
MENVGTFYDHLEYIRYGNLVYFMAFSEFRAHLVYFLPFWVYCFTKNLATLVTTELSTKMCFLIL